MSDTKQISLRLRKDLIEEIDEIANDFRISKQEYLKIIISNEVRFKRKRLEESRGK